MKYQNKFLKRKLRVSDRKRQINDRVIVLIFDTYTFGTSEGKFKKKNILHFSIWEILLSNNKKITAFNFS